MISSALFINALFILRSNIISTDKKVSPLTSADAVWKFLGVQKHNNMKHVQNEAEDRTGSTRPVIILSFDESHQLTEPSGDGQWSVFSELRRALRCLAKTPIFSLFLSTLGNFGGFSPEIKLDKSARVVVGRLARHPIITEVVFDEFAYAVIMGQTTLEQVSRKEFMSHYGRPLYVFIILLRYRLFLFSVLRFASRYDDGTNAVRAGLLKFAERKLTRTTEEDVLPKSNSVLACLANYFFTQFVDHARFTGT
jgi:hypothetical protein